MNTPLYRQRLRTANWVPFILFAALIVALWLLPSFLPSALRSILFPGGRLLSLVPWYVGSLTAAWLIRVRARRSILGSLPEPAQTSEKWGRRVIGLAAIVLIWQLCGGFSSWSCPHGDSTRFGPIAITRNSDRGPCGNYCEVLGRVRIGRDTFLSIVE